MSAFSEQRRQHEGDQYMRRIWRVRSCYKAYRPLQFPHMKWRGYIPRRYNVQPLKGFKR